MRDSFVVRWEEPSKLSTHAFGAHVWRYPVQRRIDLVAQRIRLGGGQSTLEIADHVAQQHAFSGPQRSRAARARRATGPAYGVSLSTSIASTLAQRSPSACTRAIAELFRRRPGGHRDREIAAHSGLRASTGRYGSRSSICAATLGSAERTSVLREYKGNAFAQHRASGRVRCPSRARDARRIASRRRGESAALRGRTRGSGPCVRRSPRAPRARRPCTGGSQARAERRAGQHRVRRDVDHLLERRASEWPTRDAPEIELAAARRRVAGRSHRAGK